MVLIRAISRCDTINIYNADDKHPSEDVASYSHAQKMRAAVRYKFEHEFGFGAESPWIVDPVTQLGTGNPSLCKLVENYMSSLRRRKVCAFPSQRLHY